MFLFKIQKIISLFLMITIVFSGSFFMKPQEVEATLPVWDYGNYALSILNWVENVAAAVSAYAIEIKEYVGDGLVYMIARMAIQEIVAHTVEWINTGFDGNPAFITDPEQFALDIGDGIIGDFIFDSSLNFLCSPFSVDVKLALIQDFTKGYEPKCTLSEVVDNVDGAIDDMGNQWNWDTWGSLTQNPNNNAYGAYMEASYNLRANIDLEQKQALREVDWGQGFKPFPECTEYFEDDMVLERCENVTPGTTMANQLNKSLGAGIDSLVTADELDEIVGALLVQLVKGAMTSDGVRGLSTDGLASDDGSNDPERESFDYCTVSVGGEGGELDEDADKPTYRFNNPGGDYCGGGECTVNIKCTDGVFGYQIPKSSKRYEEGDFLWEPISEDGNLAVVLPEDKDDYKNVNLVPGEIGVGYECTPVFNSGNTDGFFSLVSFKNILLGGAFGYNHQSESMLFGLDGRVNPGIKGISESVCVMREFNDYLYANTEAHGKVYRSLDGKNWSVVLTGPENIGCGMTVFNNQIYTTFAEPIKGSRTGYIYRSSDGVNWEKVKQSNLYLRDIVGFNGSIYAFGVDDYNRSQIMSSTDGSFWKTSSFGDRLFRGFVSGGDLWVGAASMYSDSGKSGIYKLENNSFKNMFSSSEYKHITYIKEWQGNLFAGTTKGFKENAGPTDLLYSSDNGTTWDKACSIPETSIWDLEVHDGNLYISTMDYGKGGNVYKVSGVSVAQSDKSEVLCSELSCFLWKPEAEHDPNNLVVLLPERYIGCDVYVDGEKGYDHRTDSNQCDGGNRGHYYFSKPGSEYSGDVEIRCDGDVEYIKITDHAEKCEG